MKPGGHVSGMCGLLKRRVARVANFVSKRSEAQCKAAFSKAAFDKALKGADSAALQGATFGRVVSMQTMARAAGVEWRKGNFVLIGHTSLQALEPLAVVSQDAASWVRQILVSNRVRDMRQLPVFRSVLSENCRVVLNGRATRRYLLCLSCVSHMFRRGKMLMVKCWRHTINHAVNGEVCKVIG